MRSQIITSLTIAFFSSHTFLLASESLHDKAAPSVTSYKPVFDTQGPILQRVAVPTRQEGDLFTLNLDEILPPYRLTLALNYLGIASPYKVDYKFQKALTILMSQFPVEVNTSWATFTASSEWAVFMQLIDSMELSKPIDDSHLVKQFQTQNPQMQRIQIYSENFEVWLTELEKRSPINGLFYLR